jgi:formate--tetrahydrofolate ligase
MTDLEIARTVEPKPINEIAGRLGISESQLYHFGPHKAKIPLDLCQHPGSKGKLVLVSAISPTPAGEGKTTCTVGLLDGLNKIGRKASAALREPSLGPVFGIKGGATGGGYAQAIPMEDINLHFTGDIYAVERAHNLLSALIDNHIQHGQNGPDIDPRSLLFKRVMDMNDRALRNITIGLGGRLNGVPRETGFDITAASELMAILCLSTDYKDLKDRLGRVLLSLDKNGAVKAGDLGFEGSAAALLKDALRPNLVQSLEGNPIFMHGGPFANIAQGTNTLLATYASMNLSEITITEAGFGFDLGGEKFIDIKCRSGNIFPNALVLVATIRALKYHGGKPLAELKSEDLTALKEGFANLRHHIANAKHFGLEPIIAINKFVSDTDNEVELLKQLCETEKVDCAVSDAWEKGGEGAIELARLVANKVDGPAPEKKFLYAADAPYKEKIEILARKYYGASDVEYSSKALRKIKHLEEHIGSDLLVCMAKTQKSISDDPKRLGSPSDYTFRISDVEVSAGAGFMVPLAGDMMRMPGLPSKPSALGINLSDDGEISGLF